LPSTFLAAALARSCKLIIDVLSFNYISELLLLEISKI
jgi:hypothetical protein